MQIWVDVLNVGHDAAKVALVLFGDPSPCPPDCAGPLGVEWSGVLAPGGSWRFLDAALPPAVRNGVLFRLTMRPLRDVAPDVDASDRPVADYLCEVLVAGPGDRHGLVADPHRLPALLQGLR